MSAPLSIRLNRREYQKRPEHHVVATPKASWTSLLPSWYASPQDAGSPAVGKAPAIRSSSDSLKKFGRGGRTLTRKRSAGVPEIPSFCNPWPSWHKPSSLEVWQALEWGEDTDPCIELARSHAADFRQSGNTSSTGPTDARSSTNSIKEQAAQLLKVAKPDFSFDAESQRAKATWLGHAGVLVQFQPLEKGGRPVRCLFDPMFSERCSPTQTAGPIRSYPPPCAIDDLPEIDVLMISHNHYDHLDYDTVRALWKRNAKTMRFLVPLGNRQWFVDCGFAADRVAELDWWDAVSLTTPGQIETKNEGLINITCTPSQHNSGRSGTDANATLWSSWYLEHQGAFGTSYRIFFAGDTGYQFHESPGWPPIPPSSGAQHSSLAAQVDDDSNQAKYPICPAFREIAKRLGPPHLLMLPIAVGATYDYLRSMAPVPDSINPIPRHSAGVTAYNHMPSWDAVRMLKAMTADANVGEERAIAMAMHWGTFVTDPVEVLKTLGQLQWACEAHEVRFARALGEGHGEGHGEGEGEGDGDDRACFLALNHGQSIVT